MVRRLDGNRGRKGVRACTLRCTPSGGGRDVLQECGAYWPHVQFSHVQFSHVHFGLLQVFVSLTVTPCSRG
jgi:hypothetical protein